MSQSRKTSCPGSRSLSRRALLAAACVCAPLWPGAGHGQPAGDDLDGKEGYIWFGNVSDAGDVASATVQQNSGEPVKRLTDLQVNAQYTAVANLYIRENLPANDAAYFKGQRIVGVLTINRRFTLVSEPTVIKRPSAAQIWARIHVGV